MSAFPIPCSSCAAPLDAGQRYCLECGARHGAARLDVLAHARGRSEHPVAPPPAAPVAGTGGLSLVTALPGPRVAGLLTLGMLVAGFALGTVGEQESVASSPVARRVVLVAAAPAVGVLPAPPAAVARVAASEAEAAGEEVAAEDDVVADEEVVAAEEAEVLAPLPEPAVDAVEPLPDDGDAPETTPIPAATPKLPPVEHVWVVSLADRGLASTFGPGSPDPWFREQLVREGVLLNNFHATARGTLANGVALLGGQGANAATDGSCAETAEVAPGTVAPGDELQQVQGDGCVYPSTVGSLPEQLTASGRSWKAYVEDVAPGRLSTAAGCEGARTPRNPFAYFRALTDAPDCATRIVGTDALEADLADPATTPSLSWIVPDACHDGREAPCADGAPSGLPAASAWLRPLLDRIRASRAYRDGGLIVVLADRAPQDGPAPDVSARKGAPAGQGGGLVPALLLSPWVVPGQQVAAAYDHFSLLGSLEDLFAVERLGQAGRPGLRTFGPKVFAAFPGTAG